MSESRRLSAVPCHPASISHKHVWNVAALLRSVLGLWVDLSACVSGWLSLCPSVLLCLCISPSLNTFHYETYIHLKVHKTRVLFIIKNITNLVMITRRRNSQSLPPSSLPGTVSPDLKRSSQLQLALFYTFNYLCAPFQTD